MRDNKKHPLPFLKAMFPFELCFQISCRAFVHCARRYCSCVKPLYTSGKILFLLKQYCSKKSVQQIHCQMLTNSIHHPNFLLSKLISIKDFEYSLLHFSHIPKPNGYAYNIMIRGATTTWQNFHLAMELYYRMKFLGLHPNKYTYPFLFIACGNLLESRHGRAAHSSVFKFGLDSDGHVNHSLITMYSRCGQIGCAKKVFDEITEKDVVSWNSMISGYSKMGFSKNAVELFLDMQGAGYEPDEMTLVSTLGACGDLGDLGLGRLVEKFVLDSRMEVNTYIGSALIDMYCKCGDLALARRVFDGMLKKDRVIWNAMITGLTQNGMSDEAILLYHDMQKAGVFPDKRTLVVVLSASAALGALEFGKAIDVYASERGFSNDTYVATALIDMYAKCGCLHDSKRIFEALHHKNEVSWNSMISALGFNGQPHEALSLFWLMVTNHPDVHPNDITFVALLSACVHAGLVEEGRRIFNLMSSSFQLIPKIEHYTCLVDLLARAGRVDEAWDFLQEMPGNPDEVMLGSLLGACQKARNIDVSVKVSGLLLDMEPSNSGNYVISSKIFANLDRSDESAKMRMMMRERGVAKLPGCSWIEIEGRIHNFHAGDQFRVGLKEVHEVLDLLIEDLQKEGYTPNVNLV